MTQTTDNEKKVALAIPDTVTYTTEERIEFIANLIVDRIIEDELDAHALLKRIGDSDASKQLALT
jgi:hypothetical protein